MTNVRQSLNKGLERFQAIDCVGGGDYWETAQALMAEGYLDPKLYSNKVVSDKFFSNEFCSNKRYSNQFCSNKLYSYRHYSNNNMNRSSFIY